MIVVVVVVVVMIVVVVVPVALVTNRRTRRMDLVAAVAIAATLGGCPSSKRCDWLQQQAFAFG